jgi:hypothetical protein
MLGSHLIYQKSRKEARLKIDNEKVGISSTKSSSEARPKAGIELA